MATPPTLPKVSLKLTHIFLTLAILYGILWILDDEKAGAVSWQVVSMGESLVRGVSLLKAKLKSVMFPADSLFTTTPTKMTLQIQYPLQNFLDTPNQELLSIRHGFYNKKASYYIQVNPEKKTCTAKYSKEFGGKWVLPAKILCPQVEAILRKETKKIPVPSKKCVLTTEDLKQLGWTCKKIP